MYPYKIVVIQELCGRDCKVHCIIVSKTLRDVHPEDVVIFSDKAYFHPSGTVKNSHPQSSSVVSAVLNFSVIGPSFFVKKMARVQ